MAMEFQGFDDAYARYFPSVWRLCFLCTASLKAAEDLTFRTFLILGAAKNAEAAADDRKIAELLYGSAVSLIRQYYEKKMRHRTNRKRLEALPLPFPVTEELVSTLRLPLNRRLVLGLRSAGLEDARVSGLLRLPSFYMKGLLKYTDTMPAELQPPTVLQGTMSDRIYKRFEERSVGVENAIHGARRTFDRIAPWLALAVLALFAFAYWYTEHR